MSDNRRLFFSLVAPVFNESECIAPFVREADAQLARLQRPYEIICADDGSTDNTRVKLLELKRQHPALRVVALERNRGQSAAFDAGIRAARGEVIGLIDADLQNDPADLIRMVEVLDGPQRPDCVAGRRAQRCDDWLRRISSRIANRIRVWLTGDPVRDIGCSLKVVRADVIHRIKLFTGMHRFLTTLVRIEGGVVVEVDVNHRPRLGGVSKYGNGLGRALTALRDALAVRWMIRRALGYSVREL